MISFTFEAQVLIHGGRMHTGQVTMGTQRHIRRWLNHPSIITKTCPFSRRGHLRFFRYKRKTISTLPSLNSVLSSRCFMSYKSILKQIIKNLPKIFINMIKPRILKLKLFWNFGF